VSAGSAPLAPHVRVACSADEDGAAVGGGGLPLTCGPRGCTRTASVFRSGRRDRPCPISRRPPQARTRGRATTSRQAVARARATRGHHHRACLAMAALRRRLVAPCVYCHGCLNAGASRRNLYLDVATAHSLPVTIVRGPGAGVPGADGASRTNGMGGNGIDSVAGSSPVLIRPRRGRERPSGMARASRKRVGRGVPAAHACVRFPKGQGESGEVGRRVARRSGGMERAAPACCGAGHGAPALSVALLAAGAAGRDGRR